MTRHLAPSSAAADRVPLGVRVAAAWAWRVLLLCAAVYALGVVAGRLSLVVWAVATALLLAAALEPLVRLLGHAGLPRLAGAWIVLIAFITALGLTGWLIGRAVVAELADLQRSLSEGLDRLRDWIVAGPLPIGNRQLDEFADSAIARLSGEGSGGAGVATAAATAGHLVTGTLLTLFVLFFFLYDGATVWAWVVRVFPEDAREPVDGAGRAAWSVVTSYVRGIIVVALADAVLIAIVLLVVGVPLVVPLAALTFLGAFVPVIGATLAGTASVLVALADRGLTAAIIVAAAVIVVQWVDSDILQPIILGRAVHIHPLAIGLAVAAGGVIAGLAGAVVAVPIVAAVNTAVVHLRGGSAGDDARESPAEASAG